MRRLLIAGSCATLVAAGCTDVTGAKNEILSIQFDTLASPSVVVGDSLRDTTGAIALPRVTAFDIAGNPIADVAVSYHAADRGVTVDSISGIIRGDSLRTTPARIIATAGGIQAQQLLSVTLRPDTMFAVTARDTIRYSLLDTTVNVSKTVTASLQHINGTADSAVTSYLVSFSIASASSGTIADLVDESGRKSQVDTTDASGLAGRRIRLRVTAPAFVANSTDSIVVNASARLRGALVRGAPVRLVVVFKPRTP